jgi:hypothetical protein
MASNYNMIGRPPLVAVRSGRVTELVRRETIADLLSRDLGYSEPQLQPQQSAAPGGCEAPLHGE